MKPFPIAAFLNGMAILSIGLAAEPAAEGSGSEDLANVAKKLNNPVASLISLPLQNNFDFGAGPGGDGFQYKLNVQPVVPVPLTEDWKLIARAILPYVYQEDVLETGGVQSGLADTTLELFISPRKEKHEGPIWGLGPAFLLPTATESLLGTQRWGAGPTGLILWQKHGWTYGLLANHIWSFAGEDSRDDVSNTFLQPFINYTTRAHTTFALNSETTYDWTHEQWLVPLNLMVSQLIRVGRMPVNLQVGARYYAEKPESGPEWGLRAAVTFVFPE